MTIVNDHGETPDEERIRLCMVRLCRRYNVSVDTGDIRVRDQIRVWFEARMEYLTEEYRCAINANDSIVDGRQLLFNSRPKLLKFLEVDPQTFEVYRDGNDEISDPSKRRYYRHAAKK